MTKKTSGRERENPLRAIGDITERKRAEEPLRESEEQWRSLVENIPDIIMTLDRNGTILFINRTPPGFTVEAAIGAIVYDYVPPEHHDMLRRSLEGVFETGDGHDYEIAAPGPFGLTSWYFNRIGPIVRDGTVVAAALIATDITERKQAEEALRESEEKYRRLAQDSIDGIVIAEGPEMTFVNRALLKMFGCQREEEMVGRPFTDFVSPEYREPLLERNRAREQGQSVPAHYEFKALRKDGSTFDVGVSIGRISYQGRVVTQVVVRDITERKLAEEALQQSEEQFRLVTDAVPVLISYVDSEQRYRFNNKEYEEWFGHPRAEVYGQHVKDILGDSAYQAIREHIELALSGQEVTFEGLMPYRDGGARHVSATYVPDVNEEGQVRGFVALVSDITDRKQAQEELRESEERFHSAFENASIGMALVGLDGRILQVNKVCCEVLGYSEQELKSMTWQGVSHPDDFDSIRDHIRRILAGEIDSYQLEKRYVHKLGHVLWGHLTSSLVRDADGKPLYFISQIEDVTDRKQAEEALWKSEDRYRTLVEAAPDVIYSLSRDGTITSLNSAFESIAGWSRNEWLGKHFTPIIHPDDLPAAMEDFRLVLRGEVPPVGEYRMLTESGQYLTVETLARPLILDGKVVGTFGIARDITERKRMEEALQKVREELEGKVEHQMLRRNPYGLTFRELTVLHLVAAGQSDKEIGTTLSISLLTAQKHLERIRAKMKASSRTEASVRAIREGLLD